MLKSLQASLKKSNFSLLYCFTFLLFVNSGFYFSTFPALSPVYIFFYPMFFYVLINIILKRKIFLSYSSILAISFICYLIIFQFIVEGKPIAILGSIATFLFFVIGEILLSKLSINKIIPIINGTLFLNLLIELIDTLYRLSLVGFNINNLLLNFYDIKKQCLFYSDTNSLAINSTILTFFTLYLYKNFGKDKYMYYMFSFILITFISCSRSAIFATVITFFILYIFSLLKYLIRKKSSLLNITKFPIVKCYSYFILIIILLVFSFILFKILSFLLIDASFLTKINLLEATINFTKKAPLFNFLFGTGYNNGGISLYSDLDYAHSYVATYFIETGLIGYLLVTIFLISILFKTPKTVYIFIPFAIMGISHISHAQLHLFYVSLILITIIERKYKILLKNA